MMRSESGPLANYFEGFRECLINQHYSPLSANNLVGVMKNLDQWMKKKKKKLNDINRDMINHFLIYRKKRFYVCWLSMKGILPIVNYLIDVKVLNCFCIQEDKTASSLLLNEYEKYLRVERILTPMVINSYANVAKEFLTFSAGTKLNFRRLNIKIIRKYVLEKHRRFSVGTVKLIVSALRSFLKWLHIQGKTDSRFSKAVPAIAGWRNIGIPNGISNKTVEFILRSFNKRTNMGRRDYAILLLMARLGFRRTEIANLNLADVHWHEGKILVTGKQSQGYLPLPEEVGKALAAYIQKSRPRIKREKIFIKARAPYYPVTSATVGALTVRACEKIGLAPIGAHKFRHTVAMRMLNKGSSLSEIAQVLRHSSIDTTSIYTKIDHLGLREVTCPWPGGVR